MKLKNSTLLLCSIRCMTKRYRSTNTLPKTLEIDGKSFKTDPEFTNVTPSILSHLNKQLHLNENHPIGILRELIEKKMNSVDNAFTTFNNFKPVVTKFQNFDSLGFPLDHPGRSKSDTYYINYNHLLRTHTSAHEMECFQTIKQDLTTRSKGYLISADVYRRDEIDRTHYPVFHQMEGARMWKHNDIKLLKEDLAKVEKALVESQQNITLKCVRDDPEIDPNENAKQLYMTDEEVVLCSKHLKRSLELVVSEVFNKKVQSMKDQKLVPKELKYRWVKAYFPWTTPSWEIEVWWQGDWLEICGSGLVQQQVLLNSGFEKDSTICWAFGLGLDRIAMLLFEIPDIRLLWTQDERFHKQFKSGHINKFKPYSKYPGSIRDMAFWLPKEDNVEVHGNDIMEIVRDVAGSLVESVKLQDTFVNPKTNQKSLCYRINYQSMDRNITNTEVNELQHKIESELVHRYNVSLR
ncbi:phenylalanyl-tRNA synthetase alpha subunit, mitochondrial [Monosporozyma unispora]|nr:phenylalanyl-tRNA synthetase alpha subunit, mitochondrial [Kazachstania unispora]